MGTLNLAHKNMDIYKISLQFVKLIYKLSSTFPINEKFGLTSQINRAAVSIVSNLAESLARYSDNEKARFLEIALSSFVELDAQLDISLTLNFCKKKLK